MTKQRMSALLILVLTTVIGVLAFVVWEHGRLIYPNPEIDSEFLKNYSPENTIRRFQMDGSSGFSHDSSAGAGHDHTTRTAGFDLLFVSRTDLYTPLQEALIDDASVQLRANGAKIMIQGFDPQGNYCFYYSSGKNIGSIKIFPVIAAPGYVHRRMPLAAELLDTRARIDQKEVWFPQEPRFDPVTFLASNQ